jgi:hypothetical protein
MTAPKMPTMQKQLVTLGTIVDGAKAIQRRQRALSAPDAQLNARLRFMLAELKREVDSALKSADNDACLYPEVLKKQA